MIKCPIPWCGHECRTEKDWFNHLRIKHKLYAAADFQAEKPKEKNDK